ncbi:ribonuclease HII [soil metagenome]
MTSKIMRDTTQQKNANQLLVGVDEAGRGPLAGPVSAAAVILNPNKPIKGLDDSKKLSKKRREYPFHCIQEHALAWAVGWSSVAEIDQINILHASLLAMKRAVMALNIIPDLVVIDGKHKPLLTYPMQTVIGGDSLIPAISAASIMAKVSRDKLMAELHQLYPDYGFMQHQGYPTKFHVQQLRLLGPTALHRQSFKPVKDAIKC